MELRWPCVAAQRGANAPLLTLNCRLWGRGLPVPWQSVATSIKNGAASEPFWRALPAWFWWRLRVDERDIRKSPRLHVGLGANKAAALDPNQTFVARRLRRLRHIGLGKLQLTSLRKVFLHTTSCPHTVYGVGRPQCRVSSYFAQMHQMYFKSIKKDTHELIHLSNHTAVHRIISHTSRISPYTHTHHLFSVAMPSVSPHAPVPAAVAASALAASIRTKALTHVSLRGS